MSSRLAFQTQLASIMEVLANAAVAEICKLVDDDYAVVSLQMSQCQRENKALKRKLHLLELKMARGNAERRLRESAMHSVRPRVQVDRHREPLSSSDGVFDRQMDVVLWSDRAAAGGTRGGPVHSDSVRSKSPDVELVEPDAMLVKEENLSQAEEIEEDIPLIRDDGVVECVPCGAAAQRPSLEQQDIQSTSSQTQTQIQGSRTGLSGSGGSRGVEKEEEEEPDVVLVKVEEGEPVTDTLSQTGLSIQEGLVESSTDDYRAVLPFDKTTQGSASQLSDLQESGRGFSKAAAPQDPGCVVSVQLRAPDTNTPSSPSRQQQRPSTNSALSSEYSLFELETFFTRWAPDGDSVSAPSGPPCSLPGGDSAVCDQAGVVIVETVSQHPHVLQPPQNSAPSAAGMSFSSASSRSRAHMQPSQGSCVSIPLRMQPLWSGKSTSTRNASAQLLQQHRGITRPQTALSSTTAAAKNAGSANKPSVSGISCSASRTMKPTVALPVRGTTAGLASIEVAIAAQHQPSHNKSQKAGAVAGERQRKSYVCRACGKAFCGLSNLEAHERVHTGERPFCCDTCGKRFSEAGNLKKHQRVHTGEKPFSCDQCGKKFAWICNLRTHQQSATGCGPQARGRLGLG